MLMKTPIVAAVPVLPRVETTMGLAEAPSQRRGGVVHGERKLPSMRHDLWNRMRQKPIHLAPMTGLILAVLVLGGSAGSE